MVDTYQVVLARPKDILCIPDIERAAVKLLEEYAPASVQEETSLEQDLREAQAGGRLWVALLGETPVGFAHVIILDSGLAHLEELDVHPGHGRRGLGRRLVLKIFEWMTDRGYPSLTLTTFRKPRFNMPFYQGLGFEELPKEAHTAELRQVVDHETQRGLVPETRVVMIWRRQIELVSA